MNEHSYAYAVSQQPDRDFIVFCTEHHMYLWKVNLGCALSDLLGGTGTFMQKPKVVKQRWVNVNI